MQNKPEKKPLIFNQILIVLWLLFAAISLIEAYKQYLNGGFKNPYVYLLIGIFLFSATMYFIRKKQRYEQTRKN